MRVLLIGSGGREHAIVCRGGRGVPIHGLEDVDPDVHVFHAGTRLADNGALVTAGGSVLGVTAVGATLQAARAKAYDNVARVRFEGAHYRRDIGLVPL